MQQEEGKHYFEFGPFRLDTAAGVLTRQDEIVTLNPKAVETLSVLVRNCGRVVSKEELMKAVWPDAFVEEANLNVQISALRKALEDSAEAPAFVETIPRRGYRFRPEVREVREEAGPQVVHRGNGLGGTANAAATTPQLAPPVARIVPRWVMAFAAVLTLGAGIIYFWPKRELTVVSAPSSRFLVAVLPFANLSGDSQQEYLSDGMTEELITELARLNPKHLGVIARTSMMPYKGAGKSVREVARELGVQYVVEGGVSRTADRLRVTVTLIQATDQTQVWATQYDREMKDLMSLRGEVAAAIARETLVRVTPEAQARLEHVPTISPQAYDAYLKGRVYWWMRTEEGYERARAYFQEALRIDPSFARAYAGMADLSTVYGMRVGDPRPYARKAVELDDSLPETHTALAMAEWAMAVDWLVAEKHFRRALELDPFYIPARHWYGYLLSHWGRHAEAIEQLQRARETDPLNIPVLTDLGQAFFFARDYERGIEPLQRAMSIDPKFPWPHYWLGRIYEMQGHFEKAQAEFELAADQPISRMDKNAALACLYAKTGQPGKAREILRRLEKLDDFLPRNQALIYAALGEKEKVFEILGSWQQKYQATPISRFPQKYLSTPISAWTEPGFDALRSDPRFEAAIGRVKPPKP